MTQAQFKQLPYVLLVLIAIAVIVGYQNNARREDRLQTRAFFCHEIEKLKAQNREEVAEAKKNFPRTLRILKLESTPEIRGVAEEGWAKKLERNRSDLKRCLSA